jgi:hypothetical protein
MDESALRSALASVNECGSSLHWELRAWTFLVVLGVALEIVFVVWEYVEDLHDFRRGIVRPPDRPNLLLFVLGFVGAALVAVGVSGEFSAEAKIATLETCIRKGDDALSLLLSKESANAEATAKRFEAQIADSNAKAKSADATSKKAEAQIAEAQKAAAESKAEAESERFARLKLEATLKHRRLTTEQTLELIGLLKPFSPTGIVIELPGNFDAETADLVSDVNAAIAAAGIPMNNAARSIMMGEFWHGLALRFDPKRRAEAEAIAGFLIRAGLADNPVPSLPSTKADELVIRIGALPNLPKQ